MRKLSVIYAVREGDVNEELRYSIRSVAKNLPHANIVICGGFPEFLDPDKVIHLKRNHNQVLLKYGNSRANMLLATESDQVTDDFWWFNDDFFITKKITKEFMYHRGSLKKLTEHYVAAHQFSPYSIGMKETFTLVEGLGIVDPKSYELHLPMLVNKEKILEAVELGSHLRVPHTRTIYGNYFNVGGEEMEDVKVWALNQPMPRGQFVSTDEHSFNNHAIGKKIREMFPDPSPYERVKE